MARRLEDVRSYLGFPSVRSFHRTLAEGWSKEAGRVTYEAARNYHYDREPPPSYLARIVEVFSEISPDYLLTGKGAMVRDRNAESAADWITGVVQDCAEGFGGGETGERLIAESQRRNALTRTWRRLAFTKHGESLFLADELPRRMGKALRGWFDAFGLDPALMSNDELTEFVISACATMRLAFRPALEKEQEIREVDSSRGGDG